MTTRMGGCRPTSWRARRTRSPRRRRPRVRRCSPRSGRNTARAMLSGLPAQGRRGSPGMPNSSTTTPSSHSPSFKSIARKSSIACYANPMTAAAVIGRRQTDRLGDTSGTGWRPPASILRPFPGFGLTCVHGPDPTSVHLCRSAEGQGFEPWVSVSRHSCFQDNRHRPLGEPSRVQQPYASGEPDVVPATDRRGWAKPSATRAASSR